MRIKFLVFAMSYMLVLGLSDSTLAIENDFIGEAFVGTVDIASVSAEVFDINTSNVPEKIKLGIKMNEGSHLPGMLMWDIDVDNDTTTGVGSTLSIPLSPCNPSGCKTDVGYDILLVLALRTQGDGALNNSICAQCTGGATQCMQRDLAGSCTGTGCESCYDISTSSTCTSGGNCFEASDTCTGCDQGTCYTLDTPCGTTPAPCGKGLVAGEWYASTYVGSTCDMATSGTGKKYAIGDIYLPLDFDILTDSEICVTLPWRRIITTLHEKQGGNCFDLTVQQTSPPHLLVSAWYDGPFVNEEDFMSSTGLDVADYVPDVAYAFQATRSEAPGCDGDFDEDGDVDGSDAFKFKSSFGSSTCPECETT